MLESQVDTDGLVPPMRDKIQSRGGWVNPATANLVEVADRGHCKSAFRDLLGLSPAAWCSSVVRSPWLSCASSKGPGLRQLHGTTCEWSLSLDPPVVFACDMS